MAFKLLFLKCSICLLNVSFQKAMASSAFFLLIVQSETVCVQKLSCIIGETGLLQVCITCNKWIQYKMRYCALYNIQKPRGRMFWRFHIISLHSKDCLISLSGVRHPLLHPVHRCRKKCKNSYVSCRTAFILILQYFIKTVL